MKIKGYYPYVLIVIWLLVLGLLLFGAHLNVTGLGITLSFLTVVTLPGFFLLRIIKPETGNGWVKIAYILGLGLGLYLLLGTLAIFTSLNIYQVQALILAANIALLIGALVRDRKCIWQIETNTLLKKENAASLVFYGLIILGGLLVFWGVNVQSDRLVGDGWFNLGILQKVVSGHGLNPADLWMVKGAPLNPVYSFPIWHIFLGSFGNALGLTTFTTLRQVILPLTILAVLIWWSLANITFKNKYLAGAAILSFFLIFLKDNTFYYLLPLGSPDTFNRLLLLPLILALVAHYLFEERSNHWFNVSLISFLAVFLGLIHFIQTIYLVLILLVMAVLLLVFDRKKEYFIKIGYLLGGMAVLVMPYLLVIQHGLISSFLRSISASYKGDNFANQTPAKANVVYRYAILILPVVALFFRKNKRLILLAAVAVTSALISWQSLGLREFFLKYLGQIFVERALANIPNFLFFGLIIFLVTWVLSQLLSRVTPKFSYLWNSLIAVLGLAIVFSPLRNSFAGLVKSAIFNDDLALFGQYFWILLLILFLTAISIYFSFPKREFAVPVPGKPASFVTIIAVSFIILSLPYWSGWKTVMASSRVGSIVSNRQTDNASDISIIGGQEGVSFLKSVTYGSVFLTDNPNISQQVLLYTPVAVAEYPYSVKEFIESKKPYNESLALPDRLAVIDQLKVDYIAVEHPEQQTLFEDPTIFQQVFVSSTGKPFTVYKYLK